MNNTDPVMPFESAREYRKSLAGLMDAHQPRNQHERMLVQELADASWDWKRARAIDRDHWDYLGTSYNRGTAGIAEAMIQFPEARLRPHRNYMLDAERRYYRALSAVERMLRDRERRTSAPAPAWAADPVAEPARGPASQQLALPANIVPIDGPTDQETNQTQSDDPAQRQSPTAKKVGKNPKPRQRTTNSSSPAD